MNRTLSFIIVLIIVLAYLLFDAKTYKKQKAAPPPPVYIIPDTITSKEVDSLTTFASVAFVELKKYHHLKEVYENRIEEITKEAPTSNNNEIYELKMRLSLANEEIKRLNNELMIERQKNYRHPLPPAKQPKKIETATIETPNEESLTITVDGGKLNTQNLAIYLLPYTRKNKQLLMYEPSCNNVQGELAKYYGGLYFFNSVSPGKYIIKICTYYGNYKVIEKKQGKLNVEMQMAPPIQ